MTAGLGPLTRSTRALVRRKQSRAERGRALLDHRRSGSVGGTGTCNGNLPARRYTLSHKSTPNNAYPDASASARHLGSLRGNVAATTQPGDFEPERRRYVARTRKRNNGRWDVSHEPSKAVMTDGTTTFKPATDPNNAAQQVTNGVRSQDRDGVSWGLTALPHRR